MRFRIGVPKGKKSVRSWDGKTGKRAQFLVKILIKNGLPEQEALEQAVITLRAVWDTVRQCDEHAPSSQDRLFLSIDDARRLNPDWWRLYLFTYDDTIFQSD